MDHGASSCRRSLGAALAQSPSEFWESRRTTEDKKLSSGPLALKFWESRRPPEELRSDDGTWRGSRPEPPAAT